MRILYEQLLLSVSKYFVVTLFNSRCHSMDRTLSHLSAPPINISLLAKNNIKLGTGLKFAVGSAFGACAILWSLLLESMIHNEYARSGGRINVVWQAPSYILIGAGEIFSISTAYEVAFTASPPNKKAFACAFNLFCIGGKANEIHTNLRR